MKTLAISLSLAFLIGMAACENQVKPAEEQAATSAVEQFTGSYADDSYAMRGEGYDWVGLTIHALSDSTVHIAVRSRADMKKPTCFLDLKAIIAGPKTLRGYYEGNGILFILEDNRLSIRADDGSDGSILYYFCSGGATLEGTYTRVDGQLDEAQVDKTVFLKNLNWDKFFFEVRQMGDTLFIHPVGLEIDNTTARHFILESVVDAEIGDLNIDGFPEVLVYLTSKGSGSYGSLIGYSVNNGKSMSMIHMPEITEDPGISEGYMGHDEFAIVESTLVRRFPIYKPGDSNANPTGGTRQLQYMLVEGEAARALTIDRVIEY